MPNPSYQALLALQAQNPNKNAFDPTELELSELASRDPNSVRPGSNSYWGGELERKRKNSDLMQANDLANVLATDKANNAAQNAGFTGNPVYKEGNSYTSHDPSMDNVGPTPASPVQRPTLTPSGMAASQGRAQALTEKQVPLDVEKVRQKGYEGRYNEIMNLLSNPNSQGVKVALPGGGFIDTKPTFAPQNNPISKELASTISAREKLDTDPNMGFEDWIASHSGGMVKTTEQQKQALDQKIKTLQAQLQNPMMSTHQSNVAPSTSAPRSFRMIHPDGSTGTVPEDRIQEAMAKGYKMVEGQQ